jgi:uncharacterized phiE125 gp8 family phage protein
MHRPVLVEEPSILPITVEEVKQALRIDHNDDDLVIDRLIRSAVDHYEGWTGILGICLVEQTWRQDFDGFHGCLYLPLGPVQGIVTVRWRNRDGEMATVSSSHYTLRTDAGGRSYVRFDNGYSRPSGLHESAAVQVEYKAGWPIKDGASTVPHDLRTAIILRVQLSYDEAAENNSENVQRVEHALISKYRRLGI